MGWKSKIQSIVTEKNLFKWYERALRGEFADLIGDKILQTLSDEIKVEFPSTDNKEFFQFIQKRGYTQLSNSKWE